MEKEQCETAAPIKAATKFENLSDEMDKTPGYITEIFGIVSNIENRLGEERDTCSTDSEKQPVPSSIIERETDKARTTNDDLIAIRERLSCVQNLF